MTPVLARLFFARSEKDSWERGKWHGRLILYTLAFTGTAVSLASVAWASNEIALFTALMTAAGVGHLVSGTPSNRRFRLSYLVYPTVLVGVWMMRGDLLAIFGGGSLFPLAKLLAFAQVVVSFNLRSLRSLYDSFLLGLLTILIVSEGALSFQFGVFLLAYGVVALAFLAAAYPVGELERLRLVATARTLGVIGPVLAIVLLTLVAALGAFLVIPQTYRVQDAGPLPSRLDLTVGKPAPVDVDAPQSVPPSTGIIPSREGEQGEQSAPADAPPPLLSDTFGGGPDQVTSPAAGTTSGQPGGTVSAAASASRPVESYVELGYTGEREKDVVMYVRSPLASYWRGQVLDEYDGRGWKVADTAALLTVDRPGVLKFDDLRPPEEGSGRYVQSFYPRVSQPQAVFTGYSPGHVAVQDASGGRGRAVSLAENLGRLREADSYRVVSAIPGLTPEALRADFADESYLFGVGDPASTRRVAALAEEIVAGAASDYDMAVLLERYLLTSFAYDLRVTAFPRGGDVVDHFLFERSAGYCSQFATAMAVMARSVGLPARVAVGYLPGEYNSLTGAHTVRQRDAHAWVEIKFMRAGWVPFDPTPRPDSPWAFDVGYIEATRGLQQIMRTGLKDALVEGPSAALGSATSVLGAYGPSWLVGALLAALIGAVGAVLLRRAKGRPGAGRLEGYTLLRDTERDAVRKIYRSALRVLARKGYPGRPAHQGPGDYIADLGARSLPVPAAFRSISMHAAHALYDPSPLGRDTVEHLKRSLRSLRGVPNLRP